MSTKHNSDYIFRINETLEFIDNNLDIDLSLEKIATLAHFSPYHFHRIFKQITNETVNSYIKRRRVEKAASDLCRNLKSPISDIAFKYGFNSESNFSRVFKHYYGVSPSKFRIQSPNKYSKIRQVNSKNSKDIPLFEEYICNMNHLIQWTTMNVTIEITNYPTLNLAYITHIGDPTGIANAYNKLIKWATPKGLLNNDSKMLTIYHDSLKITDVSKVRMSACLLLNEPLLTKDDISTKTFTPNKCIKGHYEIQINDFEKAWTGLFIWMDKNGYEKSEIEPFEVYYNNFNDHPEKKCIVDFCIPIK